VPAALVHEMGRADSSSFNGNKCLGLQPWRSVQSATRAPDECQAAAAAGVTEGRPTADRLRYHGPS
jgi:hypothetical protein